MDYAKILNDLRQKKAEMLSTAEILLADGKLEDAVALDKELAALCEQISVTESLMRHSQENAQNISGDPHVEVTPNSKPFSSLGEQLQAIVSSAKTHTTDKRLLQVNSAVKGASEGVDADGGFAIQEDFAGQILETAVSTGDILSRVDSYTVSANSNAARWLMIDETDVTASVFGGVQMYWAAEGATVTASRPKFKELKLDLEKMMGLAYATDELLQDAAFMSGFFGTAFTVAANRLLEDSIISGDGQSKPAGILSSGALITVPAEANQAAETLTVKNILSMWSRALFTGRRNAVWLIHPDLEDQLPQLTLGDKPVWMPEGGISGAQYQTILGRPVLFNDNCQAIGTKGDVMLVDLKQYMLLRKGSAKQDWSMHVEFLTDQYCFRMVLRCNGTPKVTSPVKLKNSTRTRSPFVTLADRSGSARSGDKV
ncbi:MAG: phage major capsid protein [Oscillospiraceae bacterium]|nr:phage major capsid protein [Oscillospiraceae bacterium]